MTEQERKKIIDIRTDTFMIAKSYILKQYGFKSLADFLDNGQRLMTADQVVEDFFRAYMDLTTPKATQQQQNGTIRHRSLR